MKLFEESPDFKGAVQALRQAKSVLLFTHVQPDGDGLGSQWALAAGLRQLGKEASIFIPAALPRLFRFLPFEQYSSNDQKSFDLAVSLDSPTPQRLGDGLAHFQAASQSLVIDHHKDSQAFGNSNWLEEGAAATGEMVYALLQALGVRLTEEIATGLYIALVTDTGSFRYSNTKALTHQLAAELLQAGVKPYEISKRLFESFTPASLRLLAQALGRLRLEAGGRLALLTLPLQVLKASGAVEEDCEMLSAYIRAIEGVEAAAFLRESSDGSVKLSLRSKGSLDVQQVAALFGGGGHRAAAGASLKLSLDQASAEVLCRLKDALKNLESFTQHSAL